jgi:hypothetical protein
VTQRSIQAGQTPTVVIRAGLDVRVQAWESDRVLANTESRWGLKVEQRRQSIEVSIGGSGEVSVPVNSTVKIYSGKNADVQGVQGNVAVYAGWKAHIRNVNTLSHISAGGAVDLECDQTSGDDVQFAAGGRLRCFIKKLNDVRLMVNDPGGYWEGIIGSGRTHLRLEAGGDVIIVTDQEVVAQPPHFVLGNVEKGSGEI